MMQRLFARWFAVLPLVLLSACGGGGYSASGSVQNVTASPAQFSRTMTISVQGVGLTSDVFVTIDGGCDTPVRVAGGTDLLQQFTCTVIQLGDLTATVRDAKSNELARIKITIPKPQVTLGLTQGTQTGLIVVELDPVSAPITVNNFLAYVNSGFYANTLMHRVIANFVIQGGGYTTGLVSKAATRAAIKNEASNGLKNLRGSIAMARTADPNSATSQFFFNVIDNPGLDYGSTSNPDGYAVFGKILTGLDVMDYIAATPVNANNAPLAEVTITGAAQTK